jgi:Ca-activated chloride channel family protein
MTHERASAHRSILSSSLVLVALLASSTSLVACGDSAAEGGTGGDGEPEGGPAPIAAPPEDEPDDTQPACSSLDAGKPLVLYLSADDSNSMASPAEAREAIRGGFPAGSVRTYEFLNYYDIDFPAPAASDLGLFAEAAAAEGAGAFDLLLAVRAPDAPETRRPITVTFSIDTSGSMSGSPIERARAAVTAIAGELQEGDIVNIVTWSTDDLIVLYGHVVNGPGDPVLLSAAAGLAPDGGTDLDGGLRAGYDLAVRNYGADRLNRVVLISDGGANVGVTSADLIGEHADDADREGIYLVGIGTGPIGSYSDQLMDTVTDRGRGAYIYLDSEEEAQRMLGDRFDETMEVAARNVQIELTLPWYFQMLRFYGEEYSEEKAEIEPQHLSPGDTTVLLQTIRACDPSIVQGTDPVRLRVTWQTPLGREDREQIVETTVAGLLDQDHARLAQAKAVVAFAEALKTAQPADIQSALSAVQSLGLAADPDFAEIESLLQAHP